MDQQQIVATIRSNSFFTLLNEEEALDLITSGYLREYTAGEVIFERGSIGDAMYLVLEGAVDILLSEHAPCKQLPEKSLFGELALFSQKGLRTATVSAAGNCKMLVIPRDAIDYLSQSKPRLAITILRSALEYLIESENQLVEHLDKSEHDRTHQKIIARMDALTGVFNRRAFDEMLAETHANSETGLGLIYIDLDDFKSINDLYGHSSGDQVLRTVARVIDSVLRPQDKFYRIGGDEFAVIAQGLPYEKASEKINTMCRVVASSSPILAGDERQISISASIGGTGLLPGETLSDLMAKADKALYTAKEKGKNQAYWLDR
jgi:diguanylate cyclase